MRIYQFLSSTILFTALLLSNGLAGQVADNKFSINLWDASWINVPDTNGTEYGVYLFRKVVDLNMSYSTFPIAISADNSYQLYVNGRLVSQGPYKSDVSHWNYTQIDLAPYLIIGKNCIAVRVWNFGSYRPESQASFSTGLIIQGFSPGAAIINTDTSYKCTRDDSYNPILISDYMERPGMMLLPGYYVAGPGEKVDMSKQPYSWNTTDFDDKKWNIAENISRGIPRNAVGLDAGNSWRLIPSTLPEMEMVSQRIEKVARIEGIKIPSGFPKKKAALIIPPNSKVTILLDQTYLTNAYPVINFSGGNKSIITLTYAEALYDDKNFKGSRNDINGKIILGRKDSIFSGGGDSQVYTPLTYRTYRYLEMEVITSKEALNLNDISAIATGYPFQLKSNFTSENLEIKQMLDIGWRTARLCAMDTYMDCPYWEQLQYIGDTRIQAMISLYNTGDDRLIKNALNLINYSREAEGITASRYPTNNRQIIGPFSLLYIGMLKDYLMYGSDRDFVNSKLSSTREILGYFQQYQDIEGSIKNLPGWSFTDWVRSWPRGVAPIGKEGSSALLDLQLLLAYQDAEILESELGLEAIATAYHLKIIQLSEAINAKYWDKTKGLFADTPDREKFSQQTNALAILAGLVNGKEAMAIGVKITSEKDIAPASIYFKYYVHQALVKAGLGDQFMTWLSVWRKNIELGLTTWAEDSDVENARSDCHAWGSSPNVEFYRTILGIDSDSPNFKTVKIEPRLGDLKKASGQIPHPAGLLSVHYDLKKKVATITLPIGITGNFIWKGKSYPLYEGRNALWLQ